MLYTKLKKIYVIGGTNMRKLNIKRYFAGIFAFIMAMSITVGAFAYDNGIYNTNYDWMNMRSGPGLNYSVTGQLPRNSKVNIVQVSGNWGKIDNGSWIRLDSGFATYTGSSGTRSNSAYKCGVYSVLYQGTNLRSGPGLNNAVVAMVNSGVRLNITEISGEWGKTTYNGKNCWIRLNGFAKYEGANTPNNGGQSPTSGQADAVVNKALSYVGYVETTYNNGSFYSKFGDWYGKQVGNSSFAYAPWCAAFVSEVATEAGVSQNTIPLFASCGVGVTWFKNNGCWHSRNGYTPKRGDIIFFTSNGSSPYHVGIVEKVNGNTVYTVEGNVHDGSGYNYGVRKRSYSIGSSQILGYGSPKYN